MPIDSASVLQVQPYEQNGLSFILPPGEVTLTATFDGKDYPIAGRHIAQGTTLSARRLDQRTLEVTNKINGKITKTERIELSHDLKTLTRTMHPVGPHDPNIFVFDGSRNPLCAAAYSRGRHSLATILLANR
ncbi:MAG TPA: hypothetical protein VFE61_05685 [Candidatus Sulfotelmatobacter sp.]|jgi:hypothetical protein|nr:hypothetical protein [Candidatus Sulfotelmatobacter sp.]